MLKKMAFVLAGLVFSAAALANPTFYGMTLGETTESELQEQYTVQRTGVNAVSRGNMYKLDPDEIGLEGLKSVQAVFMQDGRLGAIFAKLDKNRFGDLKEILDGKYEIGYENVPRVGNKAMVYNVGESSVSLKAPHLSFEADLDYILDEMMDMADQQRKAREQQQRQQESSQL